ncbi:YpiF family protein [Planococcus sp. YIM B11945]|uniref:YpiF family protein n=1 Tax=Planococcus sp. YIM B11945 TaxID=3435410 RepID=UPI003D7E8E50
MYFTAKDMDQYLGQKEYVDTAIVPLVEIDLSAEGAKRTAGASEYLQTLTALLEKQFKGRILLLPPVSYAKKADRERLAAELAAELQGADFKHVFYLTADAAWRNIESLENVLWLPAIPIEHMDQKFKNTVMEDQLRQVLPLFTKEWTKLS